MAYDGGNMSLDMTLAELGIDDLQSLTDTEKSATLLNLMTSSSGIFHPGAYESKEQKGARPPRGTFKPGAFFYYNNWDFNALGSIYNQLSSSDLFESLEENISDRLGMQDFSLSNTSYVYDDVSNFPAYNFKSSARDDARFGYLYLRKGMWEDQRVISEDWVEKSFTAQVETGKYYYYDYGLLWWVDPVNQYYVARGNSGQYIAVLPKEDMVIVFRADPGSVVRKWLGLRVKPQESFVLIPKILATNTD
jgi:CubicO group peptidase (beta-lactamase class C family)